jgi:hypothetical protein
VGQGIRALSRLLRRQTAQTLADSRRHHPWDSPLRQLIDYQG